MKYHNASKRFVILSLFVIMLLISGCGPSLKLVKDNFHDYNSLTAELTELQKNYNDIMQVESIGRTYEERSIYVVKLSGNIISGNSKPALMAIFTEHGDEHDVTDISIEIIKYLSKNYGHNDRVTSLLNETEVWILPMMNPDGTEYDLSGKVKPFSWRKNRKPTGENTYGVDLNRNWGTIQNKRVPEALLNDLQDKRNAIYAGEEPFSENESQAIKDFLVDHPNIKIFVDYHSGSAGFMQGGTGCYSSSYRKEYLYPNVNNLCEKIIGNLSKVITNPEDKRPAFFAVTKENDIAKILNKYAPFYIKPFIPNDIPLSPGVSGEFVYEQLGIMAIGVEIFRDNDFFRKLPKSKEEITERQIKGVLFLLDILLDTSFIDT